MISLEAMSVPLSYRHPSSSSSPPPPPQCLPLPLSLRNGQKGCSLSQAFQQSTRLPDALPGRNRLDVGRLDGGRDGRWREWWCWGGGGGGDHSGIMRLWLGYLWEHAQVRNQKMQSSRNKCNTWNRDCHVKNKEEKLYPAGVTVGCPWDSTEEAGNGMGVGGACRRF